MKLESAGLLLSLYPLGERDCIARVFTCDFGVLCGVMKGAQVSRKNKPLLGQVGLVSWNARLDSQLGVFHWEAERNLVAPLMLDRKLLSCVTSCFSLISTLLPEREQYKDLYATTIRMLTSLSLEDCYKIYVNWEVALLRELGYALDLTACSGCGKHYDLDYLSPRTGRAVCKECAIPYLNRLYKLPVNLQITHAFLERACVQQGVHLPDARKKIEEIIY